MGAPRITSIVAVPTLNLSDWVELQGTAEFEDADGNVWTTDFYRPRSGARQRPTLRKGRHIFREVYDPFDDAKVMVLDELGIRLSLDRLDAITKHLDDELAKMERAAQAAASNAWERSWAEQLP
jgi:hypothetical protein